MTSISLICAASISRNTGMATVDLAGLQFFTTLYPNAKISLYHLENFSSAPYSEDEYPVRYLHLQKNFDSVCRSDLIVYWGDFAHAPKHWETDVKARLVQDGSASNKLEAEDLIYKHFMLENAPDEILKKTILFGGTIIPNASSANKNNRYNKALRRLLTNARTVLFRDAISSAHATPYRCSITLGTDCAFLLRDEFENLETPSQLLPQNGTSRVGIFFGRSNWIIPMLLFARSVSSTLGMKPHWIPWLPAVKKRRRWPAQLTGFSPAVNSPSPNTTLAELKKCSLVVTDTYHLCVNAWRLGIPAICVGKGADRMQSTLDDKKKEILYAMYGALDFYVFSEALQWPLSFHREVNRISSIVKQPEIAIQVSHEIARHRTLAERRLKEASWV